MSKPKVAFDSCTVLHLLLRTPRWYAHLRSIYDDAEKGLSTLFISEVSVAECAKLNAHGKTPTENAAILKAFFSHKFIERRGVTSRESEFAAE